MLVLDDSAKKVLDENSVPYGEYMGPDDIFLSFLLNVAMETAIKYNDGDPADPAVASKYVQYLRESPALKKCINKLDKLGHDVLNIICDETDGKHEEILNFVPQEPAE